MNRVEYKAVNLELLQQIADSRDLTTIDLDVLVTAGIVSRKHKVKILGGGMLSSKLNVKAHAFSKSAVEAIEKLEGTTEIL